MATGREVAREELNHDGDRWRVASVGAWRQEDQTVFCHLVSLTRTTMVGRGKQRAVQINDWIPEGQIEDAMDRPSGFYRWNRSMQGAFRRGEQDAREGNNTCPYPDFRKPSGRLSWSRAYRNAWISGWEYANGSAMPGGYTTPTPEVRDGE